MSKQTLEDVQVGDQVLWVGHYNKRILTVTRLTKTAIVCEHEKFRKSDGCSVPLDVWNRAYIEVLTEDKRVQMQLEQKQFHLYFPFQLHLLLMKYLNQDFAFSILLQHWLESNLLAF